MTVGSIRAGEAYVEIAVKDTTARGVQSAIQSYGRLQQAAEKAQRASSKIQSVPGQGLVFDSASSLRLRSSAAGGFNFGRVSMSPYGVSAGSGFSASGAIPADYMPRQQPMKAVFGSPSTSTGDKAARNIATFDRLWGKLEKKFLGVGIAIGATSAALDLLGRTLKLVGEGSTDALKFGQAALDSMKSIPVLGDVFGAIETGVDNFLNAEDRANASAAKKRAEARLEESNRQQAFNAPLKELLAGERQAVVDGLRQAFENSLGGRVFSEQQFQSRIAGSRGARDSLLAALSQDEEKAIADLTRKIRNEANAAGLLNQTVSTDRYGRRITRDDPTVARRVTLETDRIRREFAQLRESVAQSYEQNALDLGGQVFALQEAELAAAAERASLLRAEELGQKDRAQLLALDQEEATLGSNEDRRSARRREEIQAERELLALQQRLDEEEVRISALDRLSLEERERLIARARELAEFERDNIAKSLEARIEEANTRLDEDRRTRLTSEGTFNATAAVRRAAENTSIAKQANALLKQIVENTRLRETFA